MVKFALSQICDDLIISPPGPNVTRKIMIDAILAHQRQPAVEAISPEPANLNGKSADDLHSRQGYFGAKPNAGVSPEHFPAGQGQVDEISEQPLTSLAKTQAVSSNVTWHTNDIVMFFREVSWFPGRIAQTYNHAGIESDFMDSSGSCNINFINDYDSRPGILARGIRFEHIKPIDFEPSSQESADSALQHLAEDQKLVNKRVFFVHANKILGGVVTRIAQQRSNTGIPAMFQIHVDDGADPGANRAHIIRGDVLFSSADTAAAHTGRPSPLNRPASILRPRSVSPAASVSQHASSADLSSLCVKKNMISQLANDCSMYDFTNTCDHPFCDKSKYVTANGAVFDYCGKTCAADASQALTNARSRPAAVLSQKNIRHAIPPPADHVFIDADELQQVSNSMQAAAPPVMGNGNISGTVNGNPSKLLDLNPFAKLRAHQQQKDQAYLNMFNANMQGNGAPSDKTNGLFASLSSLKSPLLSSAMAASAMAPPPGGQSPSEQAMQAHLWNAALPGATANYLAKKGFNDINLASAGVIPGIALPGTSVNPSVDIPSGQCPLPRHFLSNGVYGGISEATASVSSPSAAGSACPISSLTEYIACAFRYSAWARVNLAWPEQVMRDHEWFVADICEAFSSWKVPAVMAYDEAIRTSLFNGSNPNMTRFTDCDPRIFQRCFLTGDQRFEEARTVKVKKEPKSDQKKKKSEKLSDITATLRGRGAGYAKCHHLKDSANKTICYNWSSGSSCAKSPCTFAHSCFNCRSTDGHKGCDCTEPKAP